MFFSDAYHFNDFISVEGHLNRVWHYEPLIIAVLTAAFFLLSRWKQGAHQTSLIQWATSNHRRAAGVLALFTLGLCLFTAVTATPFPVIHDEFSYLLAADTFSHGKWTNPTHALWEFFETYHVLQHPSYQSKYLPAHAAFMALGKILTGYFLGGVWLELLLGIIAVYWALAAWVGIPYSLLASALLAVRLSFSAIGRGYMGGALAMAGGALVVGSILRLTQRETQGYKRLRNALLLGLGLSLLMHSRPYEGLFLAIPLLGWGLWKNSSRRPTWLHVGQPIVLSSIVTVPALGLMLYYNYRVTGDFLVFPYALYDAAYIKDPIVLWAPGHPHIEYRNASMAGSFKYFSTNILQVDWQLESISHFLAATVSKFVQVLKVFGGYGWGILAAIGCLAIRRRKRSILPIGLLALALAIGFSSITFLMPYYACPALILWAYLLAEGVNDTFKSRNAWKRSLVAACLSTIFIVPIFSKTWFQMPAGSGSIYLREKSDLVKQIVNQPGKHLILVRCDEPGLDNWIYNEANIDDSRVVWARSRGNALDAQILDYFRNRQRWTITFERNSRREIVQTLFRYSDFREQLPPGAKFFDDN